MGIEYVSYKYCSINKQTLHRVETSWED